MSGTNRTTKEANKSIDDLVVKMSSDEEIIRINQENEGIIKRSVDRLHQIIPLGLNPDLSEASINHLKILGETEENIQTYKELKFYYQPSDGEIMFSGNQHIPLQIIRRGGLSTGIFIYEIKNRKARIPCIICSPPYTPRAQTNVHKIARRLEY